ncbi:MAG: GAF domain-containing protein [Anaerolineae bacterium]|nr:GAF domain-containing protein [Anaerolineae bacterium]
MTAQTPVAQPKVGLFSVRNRLVVVMLLAVLLPVAVITYFGVSSTESALKKDVDRSLYAIARAESRTLSENLTNQVSVLKLATDDELLKRVIAAESASYDQTGEDEALESILDRDEMWREAVAVGSSEGPLFSQILFHASSRKLLDIQQDFPAHVEIFATDRMGALVLATGLTSDFYQADEAWWQAAWNDGQGAVYIDSDISYDASANVYSVIIAVPIMDDGVPIGIMRSTYDIAALQQAVTAVTLGETGHAALINAQAEILVLAYEEQETEINLENPTVITGLVEWIGQPWDENDGELVNAQDHPGENSVAALAPLTTNGAVPAIDDLGWYIVILQDEEEALKPANDALNTAATAGIVIAVIGVISAYWFSLTLTRPLRKLTAGAQRLSATRDWSARVDVTGQDEFGVLGNALNDLAAQLQDLITGLEDRVMARTRDMEVAVRVSEEIAAVLDPDQLLPMVTNLTKHSFALYHAHIYLLDEDQKTLRLAAGAGDVGQTMVQRGHRIPIHIERSIVARAARENQPMIVDDVTEAPDFLANPLLPNTRSEAAFPLVAQNRVLGVLDVQSEQVARFDSDILAVLSTLAGQVAVALDNARLFSEVERASRHEHTMSQIVQNIQGATNMDEVLQIAARELGQALRVPHTAIELHLAPAGTDAAADD